MNFYGNESRSLKQMGQELSFLDVLRKAARYKAFPVFVSLALLGGGIFVPSPLYAQQDLTVDMSVEDVGNDLDISIDSFSDDSSVEIFDTLETDDVSGVDSMAPSQMQDASAVSEDVFPTALVDDEMAEGNESYSDDVVEDFSNPSALDTVPDSVGADVLPMPTVVADPSVPALPDFGSYNDTNAPQGAMPSLPSFSQSFSNEARSNGMTHPDGDNVPERRFYDSKLGEKRNVLQDVQIRKADPVTEPGSRFVVVHKQKSAKDFDSILVAAERAISLERYQAALDFYEQLHKKNPRDERVLMGRAVALHKMGRVNSAILAYEELLERDSDNPEAVVNLMGLLRGEYPSVALQRLLELKEKNPNNPSVLAQIGITHSDIGNNVEALKYLGMASTLEPDNPQHYFNIAVLSEKMKQYKQAVANYEKALEIDAVHGSGRQISRDVIYDRLTHLRR